MDIKTEEKLSSIMVACMELLYWAVHSSNIREGDGVKEVDGESCYFSQLRVSLYKHPNDNKSMIITNLLIAYKND